MDNSGALDIEETKNFVKYIFGNLESTDDFTDEQFGKIFANFDKDGSGTVEKNEMIELVKQFLGGKKQKRFK